MAAQNIISIGFDVPGIAEEKRQVLELFKGMFADLEKYDGTRFNPLGDGGLVELKKSMTEGAAAMAAFGEKAKQYNDIITQQYQKQQQAKGSTSELTLAMQAYQKIVDQTAQGNAKLNSLDSEAAEGLAAQRVELQQRNKELANAARLQMAESGSLAEARTQVSILTEEREKLNLTTEEGTARQAELNQQINQFNAFIKENVSVLEQTKINIGNYSGSLSSAFDIQAQRLEQIKEQLKEIGTLSKGGAGGVQDYGARTVVQGFGANQHQNQGPTDLAGGASQNIAFVNQQAQAVQRLTLEEKILEQSIGRQKIGFKSANQEMRDLKNTLDALELAGFKDTAMFESLNQAYTSSQQKVKDLHKEQAILTSDAPALTALTGVARGLGGAYALGAGAAQLFATGNEKLDKELNKLVAVMTFLQGLEAAVGALKQRNAIVTALEAEASKALTFVKKIEVALFGEDLVAKEALIEANYQAALAADAAGAASGEEAIALQAQAVAAAEVVVGMEAATAATISFETAFAATGIGAIIIGIIYGVTKLVGAISDWISADERAEEAQKALAESAAEQLAVFKQLEEVYGSYGKEIIETMQRKAQLDQDAGKNQFIQLDNEKKIAAFRLASAADDIRKHQINEKTLEDLDAKRLSALQDLQTATDAYSSAKQKALETDKGHDKDAAEQAKKQLDLVKTRAAKATGYYDVAKAKYKEYIDSQQALDENRIKTQRAADEALAKLTADAAQRQFETAQASNEHILGLATSSEKDRLTAIAGNYNAEVDLGKSKAAALFIQRKADIITKKDYDDQIEGIENELAIKRQKALDDQLKTRVEFNDRLLDANNAISKNGNESDASKQDAITKDNQKELEARFSALQQYTNDKAAIIAGDYATEIAKAKEKNTTDEEYAAIESNRQKALVELTANAQKEIYDIAISWGEKRIKDIAEQNKATNSGNAAAENYNAEEQKLNAHLAKNILSYFTYYGDKKKLDEQYAVDKTAAEIKDDEARLKRLKDFQDNELQLRLNLANADLDVAKAGGDKDEIAKAQAKVDALTKIQTEGLGEINVVQKKLADDIGKNQDASANLILAKVQKTITTVKDLSMTAAQTMVGLFDAATDKQIQSLELVTERQDAATDATIAGVERGTESKREQQEEDTILTEQKAARDASTKKKVAEDKRAEAVLDRDLAIATVIWNTEAAVAKTFSEYGGTPIGFALAGVVAALGAVEVATILSKPIPAYAEGINIPGKGRHPGGVALTGEAGPELISIPGSQPFVVDKPTLINLTPDASVQPLTDSVADLASISMLRGFAILNAHSPQDNNVERAINNQTTQIVRAIRKSQKQTVTVINRINVDPFANPNDSITRKLRGTKR